MNLPPIVPNTEDFTKDLMYSPIRILFIGFICVFVVLWLFFNYKTTFLTNTNYSSNIHSEFPFVNRTTHVQENVLALPLKNLRWNGAFNCCNMSNKSASVDQLKKVIAFGFRFLDFEIEYIDQTVKVIRQKNKESFHDVLTTIQKYAFSSRTTNTHNYPLILNLRVRYSPIFSHNRLLFEKITEMFRSVNFHQLPDSEYNMVNRNINDQSPDIFEMSCREFEKKIIVLCNYENAKTNNETAFYNPFDEYIHRITKYDDNLNRESNVDDIMFTSVKPNTNLSDYGFKIICPVYIDEYQVINPSSIYFTNQFNVRAMDLSKVNSFETFKEINDSQIVNFLDDISILGSIYK